MRNLRGSRVLPAAVAVAVLGGLYGLVGVWHPMSLSAGSAPQAPRAVAVSAVTRACAAPGAGANPGSGIAVMAAPASAGPGGAGPGGAGPGGAVPGTAVVSRLSGAGSAVPGPRLLSVTQPGSPRFVTVPIDRTRTAKAARPQKPAGNAVASAPAAGGVVVQASGSLAQGLDVEQTSGTSLPTAACGSPGTDFWFLGPGQRTAPRIQLYLMNPSGQTADADVDIFTDAGPLQETTDTGISVPAHGMIVQSLATALANSRSITLHVRTSVGQVVAAVQESTGTGQGAWLPAAQAPSTQLVIPGLPGVVGTRQVYVAVPGIKDANIQVTAVTSRGSYQPTGASGIDLPGGSAAEISLPSLSGIPAALKVTANAPVTADVMIPGGTPGSPGTFTAATPAIEEQGVVADNLVGPARSSALVLSAPHGTARVNVVEIAAAGSAGQRTQAVQVTAGHSVVVALRAVPGSPRGTPFAVVITPLAGSGPVYAGRVITGNGVGAALQAMLPVASALTTVPLPPVHNASITTVP